MAQLERAELGVFLTHTLHFSVFGLPAAEKMPPRILVIVLGITEDMLLDVVPLGSGLADSSCVGFQLNSKVRSVVFFFSRQLKLYIDDLLHSVASFFVTVRTKNIGFR